MLYVFPPETFVIAVIGYERPYDDPINVKRGDVVRPVNDISKQTDIMGWTWCVAPDERAGWTPDSWCETTEEGWRLMRDFSARELTVRKSERLRLLYSESGFLFCERLLGERAWVPDGVVALETVG